MTNYKLNANENNKKRSNVKFIVIQSICLDNDICCVLRENNLA